LGAVVVGSRVRVGVALGGGVSVEAIVLVRVGILVSLDHGEGVGVSFSMISEDRRQLWITSEEQQAALSLRKVLLFTSQPS
jgi:hypothetical protein